MKKQSFEKLTLNNHYLRKMHGFQMIWSSRNEDSPKHCKNLMFWEKLTHNIDYPEYTAYRMIELQSIIKMQNPNVVIELGADLSTSIFNKVTLKKHIVIEESAKKIEKIKNNYLVNPDEAKTVFIHSDVKVNHANYSAWYDIDWQELFEKHDINFRDSILVYVNAPNDKFNKIEYVCSDPVDMIRKTNMLVDCFVFNRKSASVMNLYLNHPVEYMYLESVWLNPGVSRHHDIFNLI